MCFLDFCETRHTTGEMYLELLQGSFVIQRHTLQLARLRQKRNDCQKKEETSLLRSSRFTHRTLHTLVGVDDSLGRKRSEAPFSSAYSTLHFQPTHLVLVVLRLSQTVPKEKLFFFLLSDLSSPPLLTLFNR